MFDGIFHSFDELKGKVECLTKSESLVGGEMEGIVIRIYDSFKDDDFEKNVVFPVPDKASAKKSLFDFLITLNSRDCRLGHTLHLVS